MASHKSLPYFSQFIRTFSTTLTSQNKRLAQRGRMLEKLMKKTKSQPLVKKTSGSSKKKDALNIIVPDNSGRESRRHHVLNALFMERITDLMSTGIMTELMGHGIEITNIKVTKDFSVVNVHWAAYGSDKDNEIQELLDRNTSKLRTELISLHVLGIVPQIRFVKDRCYGRAFEVERLLKNADMGMTIADTLKDNYEKEGNAIDEDHNETSVKENTVTDRNRNIFGLDHDAMMRKVLSRISKDKTVHSSHSSFDSDESEIHARQGATYETYSTTKDIQQFLKERKIKIMKKKKLQEKEMDINNMVMYNSDTHMEIMEENPHEELDYEDENDSK